MPTLTTCGGLSDPGLHFGEIELNIWFHAFVRALAREQHALGATPIFGSVDFVWSNPFVLQIVAVLQADTRAPVLKFSSGKLVLMVRVPEQLVGGGFCEVNIKVSVGSCHYHILWPQVIKNILF